MRSPCRCQLCPKTCAVVRVKFRSVVVFLIFFFVSCGLFTFHTWRNSCWNSVAQVRDQLGSTRCTALRVTTSEQCRSYKAELARRSTNAHISKQLDNCAVFLHSDLAPQWSAEEKKLPLAFAILDHRDR